MVTVTEEGQVWLGVGNGGRPALLCSESERWRAQASIQLTLAAMTGSRAVVLDRGDILDPMGREGLVKVCAAVLGKCPIAVLVCSTSQPGRRHREVFQRRVLIEDGRTEVTYDR